MITQLPELLRDQLVELRPEILGDGCTVQVFESQPGADEKTSFGVYVENGERGFYLTAWNTGEVHISAIDYAVENAPVERYLAFVDGKELRLRFGELIAWAAGGDFST